MKTFSVLAFLVSCVLAVYAVDYCSINSCNGKKHIGCNNPGTFDSSCGPTAKKMVLDSTAQDFVVRMHNEKRDEIASGKVNPFLPAAAMKIMKWDNELATLAGLNVLQCQMKHDSCRNTERFPKSGQNLYSSWTSGAQPSMLTVIGNGIKSWYAEHIYATMADINKCPSDISKIGHFTVMVAQNNTAVGCGMATFVRDGSNKTLLACNYAATNMIGEKFYLSSEKPASGCKVRDNKFSNLCVS